jgi:putative membrane protein
MPEAITIALTALGGAALASVLACVPGLHVYNVMGALLLLLQASAPTSIAVPAGVAVPLAIGMVVGYAIINAIPSVLLAAPDESALFTVLPGQKYLMAGRGYEAVVLTAAGSAAGLVALAALAALLGPRILPGAWTVLQPHAHWILWCVIAFMLLSEWPKGGTMGPAGWRRFLDAWRGLGFGLLTFLLAGLLGFLLIYRSPVPPDAAFQNLMPAFVGLFTIPWLVLNLASRVEPPAQRLTGAVRLDARTVVQGTVAGCLGGGFAAFFPVVTGGVGGFLAGHATALRDDRMFLVSQGASKTVYYVGGLLLFFVPGLHVRRGAAAAMLAGICAPAEQHSYFLALAAVALAGAIACALVAPLTRLVIALVGRWGYRRLSWVSLGLILAVVGATTGAPGLAVAAVAAGIGLVPVLFGSRRMNCLGVILLPMACNLSGFGPTVAHWLGLI